MSDTLIAKNDSGSEQSFLGTVLQDGEQQTISDIYSPYEIQSAEDLNALILSGDITINDGTSDLSPSDAVTATQIPVVSQAIAEAGTSEQVYSWNPLRVRQAAQAVAGSTDPLPVAVLRSNDDTQTFTRGLPLMAPWNLQKAGHLDTGFTHSTTTNNTRLIVDEASAYSFGGRIRVFNGSSQRTQPTVKIFLNGVEQNWSLASGYIRNSGSSSDFWTLDFTYEPQKLNANDYVEVELSHELANPLTFTSTFIGSESSLWGIKLQGSKGDKGDTGTGSNIIVKKDGVTIGTVTDTIDILGAVPVVDEGGNVTSIEIGNWAHTSGIYQIPDAQISRTTIIGGGAVDIDDYDPGNFNLHFIDPGSNDRDFTGIVAPSAGVNRIVMIINTGTNQLKFKHEDSASTASNRLALADDSDFDLGPNGSVQFIYDHVKDRYVTYTYY